MFYVLMRLGGAGKTFFLERFRRQLEYDGYLVAYINAWRDDYQDDPFTSLVSEVDRLLLPYVNNEGKIREIWSVARQNAGAIAQRAASAAIGQLARRYLGTGIVELISEVDSANESIASIESKDVGVSQKAPSEIVLESIKAGGSTANAQIGKILDNVLTRQIEDYKKTKKSTEEFRDKLNEALEIIEETTPMPLFVIIDELDRCRPSYALALLERVKHLFEVNNIVFILGINMEQLKHSVNSSYGGGFDSQAYLRRFFNQIYILSEPNIDNFVEFRCQNIDMNKLSAPAISPVQFLKMGCEKFRINLRDIGRLMEIIENTITAWKYKFPIDLCYLFPLAVNFTITGSFDKTLEKIPDLFKIYIDTYRESDGKRDEYLEVKRAFERGNELYNNLELATRSLHENSTSSADQYVKYVIGSEFKSGIPKKTLAHSTLEGLIASAGQFVAGQENMDASDLAHDASPSRPT